MIYSIEGRQGAGKSLITTILAYQDFLNGAKIFANYSVNFSHHFLSCMGEGVDESDQEKVDDSLRKYGLISPKNFDQDYFQENFLNKEITDCVVIFDEAYIYMDSRHAAGNVYFSHFSNQARKRGVTIYFCTQHQDQIDKRLRRTAHYRVLCLNNGSGNIKAKVISLGSGSKYEITVPIMEWGHLYSTREIIQTTEDRLPWHKEAMKKEKAALKEEKINV